MIMSHGTGPRKTNLQWKHVSVGAMPSCEAAEGDKCQCACRGALHSRRLIDAVLKIPAHLRPVYTDTPLRPLTVAELLAEMQAAPSRNLLRPLPRDVLTVAEELVFAGGQHLKGGDASVRESTMLWCAFADLMTGVHALAPGDGAWWRLSWEVRAGDRAEELANWITQQVGPSPPNHAAASAETWPAMLTAASVALDKTLPHTPVTRDAIVAEAEDEKMHRHVWPREITPDAIPEMKCVPVVKEIAGIIAGALNNTDLPREDQLLVLRATAAGVCANPWYAPQVVRHALLPAVADLLNRGAQLYWMNPRQLAPSEVITRVLADRWAVGGSW